MNTIEIYWSGIGFAFNGEHMGDGIRVISICATPVDDTTSDIFAGYWISDEQSGGSSDFEARLASAKLALPDDIHIWEHQQYLDRPGLAGSEAQGFRALRQWASSFYPEPERAAQGAWSRSCSRSESPTAPVRRSAMPPASHSRERDSRA